MPAVPTVDDEMRPAVPQETIDVQALRVGMFVHLDMGWLAHPFPLSSFRIESPAQIDTIRGLGVKRLRWSPAHSVIEPGPTERPGAAADAAAAAAAQAEAVLKESAEERERAARRARLAAERARLALAERQFGEAARDLRRAHDLVHAQPATCRERSEALTRALLDKMLGDGDVCVRLLGDGIGDKAALHPLNVAVISLLMGRALGWSEGDMLDLGVGAMLHDIGKLDLPERVRQKGEHFSSSEVRAYEDHVARGVAQAARMGLATGATLVIAQHHEHADGTGFPQRIGAERMTPAARVVALVNRYDKLCNPPLGQRALTPHEALSLLFAQHRSRFDTSILAAFIKLMGVYPPGSVVQLTDDRYGMVVGVNASRPLKPRVLVHENEVPASEAQVLDLELLPDLGVRRSISPLNLPADAARTLAPRQRVAYFFEPAVPPATP